MKEGDFMAYYFTVQKKRGEYTPIDITKSKYFARMSNFKGMGMSLEEADMFTMMFNDEKELRGALFKEKLLEHRYSGNQLSIRLLRNGKYYKVIYDKTKCIWYPALFHGAINGVVTLYAFLLDGNQEDKIDKLAVFGPFSFGLISVIPFVIAAIIMAAIVIKKEKEGE